MAWREDIWEVLGVLGVRGSQFVVVGVLKPPQGDLGRGAGALEVGEINQHTHRSVDTEHPLSVLFVVNF